MVVTLVATNIVKATTCKTDQIGARMKAAREALGLSRPAFATKSGCTVRTLENNEKGANEAGACLLAAFHGLGINANWLLTGEGPMLLKDLAQATPPPPAPVQINVKALAAILHMAQSTAKPGESPEALCLQAVKFYQVAIEQGMITPTGVGDGHLKQVA